MLVYITISKSLALVKTINGITVGATQRFSSNINAKRDYYAYTFTYNFSVQEIVKDTLEFSKTNQEQSPSQIDFPLVLTLDETNRIKMFGHSELSFLSITGIYTRKLCKCFFRLPATFSDD